MLEPENTAEWRAREIGRALVVVDDRLRENGFQLEMLAPSNSSMANVIAYFDEMIKVPGVLGRLNTVAYHRYGRQRTSDVERIRSLARDNGLKTAMLERIDGDINTLLEDLTVGNVSSWQQWGPAARLDAGDSGSVYASSMPGARRQRPRLFARNARTASLRSSGTCGAGRCGSPPGALPAAGSRRRSSIQTSRGRLSCAPALRSIRSPSRDCPR